jgi:hypothetical protein
MNRDDIIRMAHEAGFSDIVKKGVWITDGFWDEELERFAELVAAADRKSRKLIDEERLEDMWGKSVSVKKPEFDAEVLDFARSIEKFHKIA